MESIIALVVATSLLVAIPGPNVILIIANALQGGFRAGAMSVLGTTAGIAAQLVLVTVGLTALVTLFAAAFVWVKWLGVAYLIYLGIKTWREPVPEDPAQEPDSGTRGRLFVQGCLVALINPKTLLFNAAFLPQFLSSQPGLAEIGLVAGIYLAVLFVGDLAWAALAAGARPVVGRVARFRNRLTGSLLVGSGLALAMSRAGR